METTLRTTPYKNGRTKVEVEIRLAPDEAAELERKQCQRHVDSALPIPCQLYQQPSPDVKMVLGLPVFEGTPTKAFILPRARKVALNRAIPGKTLLRLSLPGATELGFVNAHEMPRFHTWWKGTAEKMKTELKALLFGTDGSPSAMPAMPVEEARETTRLNPMDPGETKGIRRRAIEEF